MAAEVGAPRRASIDIGTTSTGGTTATVVNEAVTAMLTAYNVDRYELHHTMVRVYAKGETEMSARYFPKDRAVGGDDFVSVDFEGSGVHGATVYLSVEQARALRDSLTNALRRAAKAEKKESVAK